MENKAKKLEIRYKKALEMNNKLASEISANGGGATGMTAVFFVNAGKDLMKVPRQVKAAFNNGEITVSEYQSIMN